MGEWLRRNGDILLIVSIFVVVIALLVHGFLYEKAEPQNGTKDYNGIAMEIFVDPETGVEYFVYDGYHAAAMTVRYNEDGTVRIHQE